MVYSVESPMKPRDDQETAALAAAFLKLAFAEGTRPGQSPHNESPESVHDHGLYGSNSTTGPIDRCSVQCSGSYKKSICDECSLSTAQIRILMQNHSAKE